MSVRQVFFKGEPIEVQGDQPKLGESAPNASLVNQEGETVHLADILSGKVTVISVVPDVTTLTCELQTKRFAAETENKGYQFITVSKNTVDEFSQWKQDHDLDLLSFTDAQDEFGDAYGLHIEIAGDKKLTRSVFVVDGKGIIRYSEIVSEVSDEPSYEPALNQAEKF